MPALWILGGFDVAAALLMMVAIVYFLAADGCSCGGLIVLGQSHPLAALDLGHHLYAIHFVWIHPSNLL